MDYVSELRQLVGHRPLILPGSVVIILNHKGEVLLQQRTDGSWGLPGGLMELGESLEETARREVYEETGLELGELTLLDVLSGSDYYLKVANGDELYSVTAVYVTKEVKGELTTISSETLDLRYFDLEDLPKQMAHAYKRHLNVYKTNGMKK
ncbi:NUDIX hydrolase [Camelliibacillus cellulosilyticus]|uniref:NUDIX hydrolase n=1 Tax=Camelliibacillus cellulosilyticus TaxID=2174486 RepID=A0ABV9GHH9_9BACL